MVYNSWLMNMADLLKLKKTVNMVFQIYPLIAHKEFFLIFLIVSMFG